MCVQDAEQVSQGMEDKGLPRNDINNNNPSDDPLYTGTNSFPVSTHAFNFPIFLGFLPPFCLGFTCFRLC